MTHQMNDAEVVDTIGQLLEVLSKPGRDPELFRILEALPLTSDTMQKLIGALAVRAGGMTLEAAGLTVDETARVSLLFARPADDIAEFAKVAGDLIRRSCDFLLSVDDAALCRALNQAVVAAVNRGPEFTFLVLGEVLGHIRRLLHDDRRGVIRG